LPAVTSAASLPDGNRESVAGVISLGEPDCGRTLVLNGHADVVPEKPIVNAVQTALARRGQTQTAPTGETDGSDARHYIEAGIPTVVYGPGRIEAAHFPDESIRWDNVLEASKTLRDAAIEFLST